MSVATTPAAIAVENTTPGELPAGEPSPAAEPATLERLVERELLVEDVSIDGMCGVY